MLARKTPPEVEIAASGDPRLPDVLALIQASFAYMDGVIDPPSSIHRFDLAALERHATRGELIVIGTPPLAAMIMQEKANTLYLGKLAVDGRVRGRGLAWTLVEFAAKTARELGLSTLTLQSRVELTDNHAAFAAMGFVETGRTTHAGFQKPTSITFTMPV